MDRSNSASGRKRKWLVVSAAALALVCGLACQSGGEAGSRIFNKPGPSTAPLIPRVTVQMTAPEDVPVVPENPSDDELKTYLGELGGFVWPHYKDRQTHFKEPKLVYVPSGTNVTTGCHEGMKILHNVNAADLTYCGEDITFYAGREALLRYYKIGKIVPPVVVAHEFGHHLQKRANMPQYKFGSPEELTYENVADCLSGTFAASLPQLSKADNADIGEYFDEIEAFKGRRKYGPKERRNAYKKGFNGGVKACYGYYPERTLNWD